MQCYNFKVQNNSNENKIRVGILRGGTGDEYHDSIARGGDLLTVLAENLSHKYKPVDIFIDRQGAWHVGGMPVLPVDLIHKVDVVWNTTHPSYSATLDGLAVPNIGHHAFFLNLENDQEILGQHAKSVGIKVPKSILFPAYQADMDGDRQLYPIRKAKEVHAKFGAPWLVKAMPKDPDMGIHVANIFGELVSAIDDGVNHEKSILVQELIAGKEASVYSVPHFRKQPIYTFPLVHHENESIKFSNTDREKLFHSAKSLHTHLGARHYLKSSFIITPTGRVYLISIESNPELKEGSHFQQVCESVGAKMHHVVEHVLDRVLG